MTSEQSTRVSDEELSQYSASNLDQLLERKRDDVKALQRRVQGQEPPEPEPEPEPEPQGQSPQPPETRARHVKISMANVRRFPSLARYSQQSRPTQRLRIASGRFGQPPSLTPNMRDLHNTRLMPPTDYEIIPAVVISENAYFEQRMRTTRAVANDKPTFYPCSASAARHTLANSGSTSCLPPSIQSESPAWGFSGSPQWQPTVRQTIGGQDMPAKKKSPFRPCSASAARDRIKGRVTLWSRDETQRVRELHRQQQMARECAAAYAASYPTANRPQPLLAWAKAC